MLRNRFKEQTIKAGKNQYMKMSMMKNERKREKNSNNTVFAAEFFYAFIIMTFLTALFEIHLIFILMFFFGSPISEHVCDRISVFRRSYPNYRCNKMEK